MNLLEKMKLIAEGNKIALEDSPDICRAVLDAMDEIESEATSKSDDISDRMFAFGVRFAIVVIRRHLEGEKNDN